MMSRWPGMIGHGILAQYVVMRPSTPLVVGVLGTTVVALCCFTPLLAVALGALGLAAWVGWLDVVLLPALAFFAALTLYALYRRSRPMPAPDE